MDVDDVLVNCQPKNNGVLIDLNLYDRGGDWGQYIFYWDDIGIEGVYNDYACQLWECFNDEEELYRFRDYSTIGLHLHSAQNYYVYTDFASDVRYAFNVWDTYNPCGDGAVTLWADHDPVEANCDPIGSGFKFLRDEQNLQPECEGEETQCGTFVYWASPPDVDDYACVEWRCVHDSSGIMYYYTDTVQVVADPWQVPSYIHAVGADNDSLTYGVKTENDPCGANGCELWADHDPVLANCKPKINGERFLFGYGPWPGEPMYFEDELEWWRLGMSNPSDGDYACIRWECTYGDNPTPVYWDATTVVASY